MCFRFDMCNNSAIEGFDHSQTAMKKQDLYKRGRSCPEVTCLTFGRDRKKDFPNHFFCHACDLLEDAVLTAMKLPKLCGMKKKYMCTASHTDLVQPTTLKKQYRANQAPKDPPATTTVAEYDKNCDTDQIRLSPTKSPWKKKRCQMMPVPRPLGTKKNIKMRRMTQPPCSVPHQHQTVTLPNLEIAFLKEEFQDHPSHQEVQTEMRQLKRRKMRILHLTSERLLVENVVLR